MTISPTTIPANSNTQSVAISATSKQPYSSTTGANMKNNLDKPNKAVQDTPAKIDTKGINIAIREYKATLTFVFIDLIVSEKASAICLFLRVKPHA